MRNRKDTIRSSVLVPDGYDGPHPRFVVMSKVYPAVHDLPGFVGRLASQKAGHQMEPRFVVCEPLEELAAAVGRPGRVVLLVGPKEVSAFDSRIVRAVDLYLSMWQSRVPPLPAHLVETAQRALDELEQGVRLYRAETFLLGE